MSLTSWNKVQIISLLSVATAIAMHAQTFSTLVEFRESNGSYPYLMTLIQGTDGSLYGTTMDGGNLSVCQVGCGTIFRLTPQYGLKTIYSFCSQPNCADGGQPQAGLIEGRDGNFYGTTLTGGDNNGGTVFRISRTGDFTTLHLFQGSEGRNSSAALVQGSDGNFYGTTQNGGTKNDGTVFKMTPAGILTTLHSFEGPDGAFPYAALIQATDGNFYGTTLEAGPDNGGTIFRITPRGSLTTLNSSGSVGVAPYAGLVQGSDGSLYGTMTFGGGQCGNGCGTIFKIDPAGQFTTVYNFCAAGGHCLDGITPYTGLIQASDGNFYGTTEYGGADDYGTIYQFTPGGTLTVLHGVVLKLRSFRTTPAAQLRVH